MRHPKQKRRGPYSPVPGWPLLALAWVYHKAIYVIVGFGVAACLFGIAYINLVYMS